MYLSMMDYIVTKSQLQTIVTEQKENVITKKIQTLFDSASDVLSKAEEKDLVNWRFWRTWGAGIAGFVGPISEFVNSGEFSLEPWQASLVIISVLNLLFNANEKQLKKLYAKIKEEGLEEVFTKTLTVGMKLKKSFLAFMDSLNIALGTTFEMMHYAFLIPIIDDLVQVANQTTDYMTAAALIAKRIVLAKGISLSGTILTEIIAKILKRFSSHS